MATYRKIVFSLILLLPGSIVFSQKIQFSLSTSFDALRSFKEDQKYWAVGQTVVGHFHFTSKNGFYAWISYYSNGKFDNRVFATAKVPATSPQIVPYINSAELRFKHISFGWKHYLKGSYNAEEKWNFYGYAGLGLMLGSITNRHSAAIDSADYIIPVLAGKGNFKRLTFDLGLGYEYPLGGDVFFYLEGRTLIPTTDYPSNYLFINKYAPVTASVNIGFRVLID